MPTKKTPPKPARDVLDAELCEVIEELCNVLDKLGDVLRHKRLWLARTTPPKKK